MSGPGIVLCEPSQLYNILNQGSKYPRLSDPSYLLLLDTRKREDYNESHIITAKFAPRTDTGAFEVPSDAELETKIHVVVYDGNTSSTKDKGSHALFCAKLMWDMGSKNPVKVVKGGYEEFSALYPFLRTQKIIYMPRELDVISMYPVEVIPGFLYTGTFAQAQDPLVTKHLKVKAHVNVSLEEDKFFSGDGTVLGLNDKRVKQVLNVPVADNSSADLFSHLWDVVHFIDDHRTKDGRSVLVFSSLGISRCVAVAISYLMWIKKQSLKDSYNHMKQCNEGMQPTRGFIEQLSRFEQELFGKLVTDISESEY